MRSFEANLALACPKCGNNGLNVWIFENACNKRGHMLKVDCPKCVKYPYRITIIDFWLDPVLNQESMALKKLAGWDLDYKEREKE